MTKFSFNSDITIQQLVIKLNLQATEQYLTIDTARREELIFYNGFELEPCNQSTLYNVFQRTVYH